MSMSYVDRLIENLKKKIDVLNQIYECNEQIRSNGVKPEEDFEVFDDYLEESDRMVTDLEVLDSETDEIRAYIESHRDILLSISNIQSDTIRSLLLRIEERAGDVHHLESQVREVVDKFIRTKREGIGTYKKQSRVMQGHYMPQKIMTMEENTTFDVKN